MTPENKESQLLIRKEVLNYLAQRNFGVYMQYGYYSVIKLDEAKLKMSQEKYLENLYNYKLRLSFSTASFYPQEEFIALFAHLYNKTQVNKNHLIENINDLTDGNWKKDISKFLSAITDKIEDKKNIILNINNSALGLNTKNIKQIHEVFKDLPKEEKIDFWVKFFNKRKKALNNNKGGSEIHKFLTEYFTKEEIKDNFLNLSPYISDLFENTVDVEIFSPIEKYQRIIPFEAKTVEKALKIPGLNTKKISFELPKMMNWLSSIMGYKHETINDKSSKVIKFVIYSNDIIDEELFKQNVQDYLVFLKNNNGDFIEKEEDFAKWYMKNKLNKKLIEKDIKIKSLKI